VLWWVDSGFTNNVGIQFEGVYYELCWSSGLNTILRTFDLETGAEIQRRDFGVSKVPAHVYRNGDNLYAFMQGSRVDLLDTSDLSSLWTFDDTTNGATVGVKYLIQDDYVIMPYKVAGVDTWKAYQNGTSNIWSLGMTNVIKWHGIDGSGRLIASGNGKMRRYNLGAGTAIDDYTPSTAGTAGFANVVLDGTSYWCNYRNGVNTFYVRVDSSLAEEFTPASTPLDGLAGVLLLPFSGGVYSINQRYVYRVTTAGSTSQRFDRGGSGNNIGGFVHGDQDRFEILDTNAGNMRLRFYDDTSAPATLFGTLDPTVNYSIFGGTQHLEYHHGGFIASQDDDGNIYVTGDRLAATLLDKVP
jgi:hypothetical protein